VELLAKKGKNVRPAVRDEKKGAAFKSLGSSMEGPVSADVTKLDTLAGAITGASAVIFAASASSKGGSAQQVDYMGVENVAKECVRLGIPRLIVISSGAITKPDSLGFKITNLFGGIMDYKLKGENALRNVYSCAEKSGFVIIRPGGLMDNFASGVGSIELNQGDTISGEVNRADVAECAVAAALSSTMPRNVIFEMYEGGRSSPLQKEFPAVSGFERSGATLGADYEILFKGLKSDSS
jgi:nucleoside-diphosphate-sugar epimerase